MHGPTSDATAGETGDAYTSAGAPICSPRPLPITAMRSASANASSAVVRHQDGRGARFLYDLPDFRLRPARNSLSRLLNGSSSSRATGSGARARAQGDALLLPAR